MNQSPEIDLRLSIRREILQIEPLDRCEHQTQKEVLAWIDSGVELCRLQKPATPNKHLVTYFVLCDEEHILLVDHKKANLWLPTGGHVEKGEHPKQTVLREVKEELGIEGTFLIDGPAFLTSTTTVGKTAGHTDITLWYILSGDQTHQYAYDEDEFWDIRWFHHRALPKDIDPEMNRFLDKLSRILS